VAEANATMCGYLFAAAKGGNIAAIIFSLKKRAWRERMTSDPIAGTDAESNSPVVLVLPDNSRDPELTEVLRDAQEKYFARKPRRQPPEVRPGLEGRPVETDNTVGTLPKSGRNLFPDQGQTASTHGV
jgi:hypothetical protein